MGPRSKLNFSEYRHVAYQIKDDDAGNNMVANILPTDTPSTQGVGAKGQTISFSKVVMLHIKLNIGAGNVCFLRRSCTSGYKYETFRLCSSNLYCKYFLVSHRKFFHFQDG